MRMVAAVVVAWLLSVATAWAQSDALLVLPVTVDDDVTWMPQAVRDVSRGLRRQGVAVWQEAGAVAAFEARGSASPTALTDEAIEAWSSEAGGALRSLAKGNEEDALVRLEAANAFARASIAALGRDSARSTQVVDTCLYLVRAKLAVGDEAGADAQASECVRLQTSVEPTWRMHPPQVVDRYQAAKDEPHDRSILVESDPSGCAVRVNGSLQGRTPLEVEGLYPGPYAVQVECEEDTPGRVHEIDVTRGATSLFVFDAFDRAVRTAPVLHLAYTEAPSQARLARDARQFMSTLPASGVVIASRSSDGEALTLSLLRGTGADRTFVRVPADGGSTDPGTLTQAAAALVAGECRDFAVEPVASLDCRTGQPLLTRSSRGRVAESKPRRIRPPRGQFVAGVTLAAAGTTSLLAGYGLLIGRRTAGESWLEQPSNLSRQDRWLRLGTGVTTTGAAGGGLLVAAMPLVLPYQSKTPWWAWLHGGLGVAAAVGSIVSAVTASPKPPTPCSINGPDPAPCVNRERDTDRAILLGATAAPLLTVPLVYLFRRDRPDRRADILPSVVVARSQGALSLRGTF
ncbi:MAG: PEGA domain-containing protein [Myxococcota bacterium]